MILIVFSVINTINFCFYFRLFLQFLLENKNSAISILDKNISFCCLDIIKEKRTFEDVNMAGCVMSKTKLSSHNTNSHVPMIENLNKDSCQYENMCDFKSVLNHFSDENTQNSVPIKKFITPERNSVASKPHITPSEGFNPNKNWHDASQISGPDRKSKLTPLSQTGFRDPASMGGGQQLTLLSIEVW